MKNKKSVLIISYHYLPEVMAASFRVHAWAKYLPKFGWEPIILTRHWDANDLSPLQETDNPAYKEIDSEIKCAVYRTPYKQSFKKILFLRDRIAHKKMPLRSASLLRRFLSFLFVDFLYPDTQRGWYKYAYETGLSIINQECVSVILATGAPWTAHWIASRLSRHTGISWVADYRDAWTQKTTLNYPPKWAIWRFINRPFEKSVARTSSAIIHVSKPLRDSLSNLLNKKVHLIPNGFDPEVFDKSCKNNLGSTAFTISSIGTLGANTLTNTFMRGFYKFIRDKKISSKDCKLIFTGAGYERIKEDYPESSQLSDFITFNSPVSQREAIRMMCQSHILLLFPLDMEGVCPAKTFDYLASRRPVLVSPDGLHRGVIRELLSQTNGGVILDSPQEVARWLEIKFEEFSATGYVRSDTNWSAVEEYSRENQAMKLSQILKNAAHNARH